MTSIKNVGAFYNVSTFTVALYVPLKRQKTLSHRHNVVCHKTRILFSTTWGKEAVLVINLYKNTTVKCFQTQGVGGSFPRGKAAGAWGWSYWKSWSNIFLRACTEKNLSIYAYIFSSINNERKHQYFFGENVL